MTVREDRSNVASPRPRTVRLSGREQMVLCQLLKDDIRKSLRSAERLADKLGDQFNPEQAYRRSNRAIALYERLGGCLADLIIVNDP